MLKTMLIAEKKIPQLEEAFSVVGRKPQCRSTVLTKSQRCPGVVRAPPPPRPWWWCLCLGTLYVYD